MSVVRSACGAQFSTSREYLLEMSCLVFLEAFPGGSAGKRILPAQWERRLIWVRKIWRMEWLPIPCYDLEGVDYMSMDGELNMTRVTHFTVSSLLVLEYCIIDEIRLNHRLFLVGKILYKLTIYFNNA